MVAKPVKQKMSLDEEKSRETNNMKSIKVSFSLNVFLKFSLSSGTCDCTKDHYAHEGQCQEKINATQMCSGTLHGNQTFSVLAGSFIIFSVVAFCSNMCNLCAVMLVYGAIFSDMYNSCGGIYCICVKY